MIGISLLINKLMADSDPITDFLNRDWASVGGWSLFFGLVILIILGAFRGWWIPGWIYKRQSKTLDEAMKQNRVLLSAAEITKHFFESTAPRRHGKGRRDVK